MSNKKVIIIIFAVTLLVYLNSLNNDFVADDLHMIVNNAYIKSIKFWPLFFKGKISSVPIPIGMFRPLLMISFSVNYLIGRLQPFGYHLVNILFHIVNGALLFFVLRLILGKNSFISSFLVSLLFLVHPVHSQAVNYISCRSTLMASSFVLFAFLFYMKRNGLKNKIISIMFYLFGLLSKEIVITFLFILVIYEFIFFWKEIKVRPILVFKRLLPFFLLSIIYLFWRGCVFGKIGVIHPVRNFYSNLFTQIKVTIFYIRLLFFPFGLCVDRYFPVSESFWDIDVIFPAVAILSLLLLAGITSFSKKIVSFSISWFLVTLLPMSFSSSLYIISAEHHLYLPSIGFFILVVYIFDFLNKKAILYKRGLFLMVVLILSLFSLTTILRNRDWSDGFRLWLSCTRVSDLSGRGHNNLGVEYAKLGILDKAVGELETALSLNPFKHEEAQNRHNLAMVYRKKGDFKKAIEQLELSLEIDPNFANGLNTLGLVYIDIGKGEKAIEYWKKAIQVDPYFGLAYVNIGNFYLLKGDYKQARQYLERSVLINPDISLAHLSLGIVYEKEDEIIKAIREYKEALKTDSKSLEARYNLANLYGKQGDIKALEEFKILVRLYPDYAPGHYGLGISYLLFKPDELAMAKRHLEIAKRLGHNVDLQLLKSFERSDEIEHTY